MSRPGPAEWVLKVLSVLLAVILWVYVSNEANPTKEREFRAVPVEVKGLQSNLAVSQLPGTANVRVQANQSTITELNPKSIEVFVDLTNTKPGLLTLPVQVKVPAGVKILDLRPQEVKVYVEPQSEKQVPLKVVTGEPVEGYKVLFTKTRPEEVVLRGPGSMLEDVSYAVVRANLEEKQQTFSETVPVQVIDEGGNSLESGVVRINPAIAELFVSIGPDLPSKTVRVIPRVTGEPAKGLSVTMTVIDPAEIVITGKAELINSVTDAYTQLIDISGAREDLYLTEVRPDLPQGVSANVQALRVVVRIGQE